MQTTYIPRILHITPIYSQQDTPKEPVSEQDFLNSQLELEVKKTLPISPSNTPKIRRETVSLPTGQYSIDYLA
tara:strand:- start:468 stop:686 length:219 start_codon:yes stop_codon:yes gene_type:complete